MQKLRVHPQFYAVAANKTNGSSNLPAWAGIIAIALAVFFWVVAPTASRRIAAMYQGTRLSKLWGNPKDYLWAARLSAILLIVVGVIMMATGSW